MNALGSVGDAARADLYADFHSTMLLESPSWIHRRVETLRLVDDETIRFCVSIDFSLDECSVGSLYREFLQAGELPAPLIPIGLFNKRNLEDFDLRDVDGKPLSFLTKSENVTISSAMLVQHTRSLVGEAGADRVAPRLRALVNASQDDAPQRLKAFSDDADDYEAALVARQLLKDPGFFYLANSLARKFLAVAILSELPKGRSIIKYSYVRSLVWNWDQIPLASRFGWQPASVFTELPALRACGSYHLEVEAPPHLELRQVTVSRLDQRRALNSRQRITARIWHSSSELLFEKHLVAQVTGKLPRAHLATHRRTYADNRRYQLEVQLAPQRRGFVRGAAVATFFALVATLVVGVFHARIAERINQAAAGFLLIVPGILAAQMSRPSEHPIASRLYFGLRAVLAVAAGCTWLAAAAIALDLGRVALNRLAYGLVVVAALTFLATLAAYIVATGRSQPEYEQEEDD